MQSKPLYPNSSVQALLQVTISYLQLHWAKKGVIYAFDECKQPRIAQMSQFKYQLTNTKEQWPSTWYLRSSYCLH